MSEEMYSQEIIMQRIQALLELARRGGSEHEMANAAAKAQTLMTRYNLSQAEIEIHQGKPSTAYEKSEYDFRDLGGGSTQWRDQLLHGICKYNFAKSIRIFNTSRYYIVGYKHNIEMCQYLLKYLDRQMRTLCEQRHSEALDIGDESADLNERTWKNSYLMGLTIGIIARLRDQYQSDTSSSTALVVVKDDEIKAAAKAFFPEMRNTKSRKQMLIDDVTNAGRKDASRLRMDKPISDSKTAQIH